MKGKVILHGISALCSILVYAFFALPFYSVTTTLPKGVTLPGVKTGTTSTSGYNFLKEALKSTSSSSTGKFAVVMALIMLIVAGIAFIAAVVALLSDFKVIKNELVAKIVNWVAFATAALLAVFVILNLVGNLVLVNNDVKDLVTVSNTMLSTIGGSVKATAGWALTVITLILGLGAAGTSTYAKFSK